MRHKRFRIQKKTRALFHAKGALKRGTACLLAAVIGLGSPMQAAAAVGATSGNTPERNQQILTALQAITGDEQSAKEIYQQLKTLDLFDESGNLITENILVDGEEKTVWEVLEMIETMDEAELDKTVTAVGRQITFRDLKTMAEIEAELMRIQATYFNPDVTLTDEQNAALDSLYEQLGKDGISIQGFTDVDGTIAFSSGIDRENTLSVDVSYKGSGEASVDDSGNRITVPNQAGQVMLNVKLAEAADYPVYFQVRTLDGTAKAGTHYSKLPETDSSDDRAGAERGENLISCMIPAGSTSANITVDLKEVSNESQKNDSWSGDRSFFLELRKPENTSFGNEKMFRLIQVSIAGEANHYMPSDARWSGEYFGYSLLRGQKSLSEIDEDAKSWLTENRSGGDLVLKKSAQIKGHNWVEEGTLYGVSAEVPGGPTGDLYGSTHMGYRFAQDDATKLKWYQAAHENADRGIYTTPYGAEYFCDPDWPYPKDESVDRKNNTPVSDSLNFTKIESDLLDRYLQDGIGASARITRIKADWDPMFVDSADQIAYENDAGAATLTLEIQTLTPRLVSAKGQPGHYSAGGKIPVVVEFSHPVTVKSVPKKTERLELAERAETSSKYLTVLVDWAGNAFETSSLNDLVTVDELTAFLGTGEYLDAWTGGEMTMEADASLKRITDTGVDMVQNLREALDAGQLSVTFWDSSVISPEKDSARVKIPLSNAIYKLLADTAKADEAANIYTSRLAVSADGKEFLPLYFADANGSPTAGKAACLVGTVPLPTNASDGDIRGAVELYWMKDGATLEGDWTPERVVVNQYGVYTRQAAVLMTGEHMEIRYPDGFPYDTGKENDEIFLDSDNIQQRLKLDWGRIAGSPENLTWPEDVSWAPADEESAKVASIDQNGQITLTGNSGQARFALTAKNGGFTPREGEEESLYQVVSEPIRAGVGNTPFLLIPQTSRIISAQAGQPAVVMWQTNLFDKNGIANEDKDFATDVTITLYKAVYDAAGEFQEQESLSPENQVGDPITLTGSQNRPVNEYAFNGLEKLQANGRHSYVFQVEMTADENVPGDWSKTPLQAVGYLDVSARPASIAISRPDGGLYQTDEAKTMTLTWHTADIDPVEGAEAYVAVTDNETGEKVFEKTCSGLKADVADGDANGTVTFPLEVANGFRTTYTVEAKIKNKNDTGWSTDSYQLNLYQADSLKLLINGEETTDGQTVTISNREWIADLAKEDPEKILELNRKIFLQGDLSINHQEYNWMDLEDRMRWSAESKEGQGDTAQIQTLYGSKYYDIRDLNFETYSPSQEQLLVGLSDGTARVSVEHHFASELNAGVDVEIETLKDQLYLFQFYPMRETTITYVNGDGETKTAVSNDRGEAAVYEPSGIRQDVYARSGKGEDLYMGTLYQETLETSEKDAGSLELYPLNVLQLKKASMLPLAFRTPDGMPYTGKVTVRGGVLLDGVYHPEIKIDHRDGAKDYELEVGEWGSHTFEFDMTQFPETYTENAIRFILEFRFEDDAYEPVYLDIDGTLNAEAIVRQAQNFVELRDGNAGKDLQPVTVQKRLYFRNNTIGGYRNVLDTAGRVGPGTNYPAVTLETIGVWWGTDRGETDTDKSLLYLDKYGKALPSQTSELIDYEFLSMPIVKNLLVLDENAMDEMDLDMGETLSMELAYRDSKEKLARQETSKLRVINMLGVEDVTSSERLSIILHEMTTASTNSPGVKFGNSMAGLGLELSTRVGINTDILRLQLLPTEDPTRFQGFVTVGLNNMTGDNISGLDPQYEAKDDLDYTPGFSDIKTFRKNGLKNGIQEEKTLAKYASSMVKDQGKRGMAQGFASNGTLKDDKIYYAMKGYFETEVFYDYETQRWEMAVLNGGFTVGGGYGRDWKWNASVGPVPVVAELGFGAGLTVNFQAAADRQEMVNEYLTELRVMAYFRAFAGIGFDHAVIALRLGLYGQINLDARINFLNSRDNVSTPKVGLFLKGDGEFGILFAIKFLFVSYEKILVGVSGEIGRVNNKAYDTNLAYWERVKNGKSGQDVPIIEPETAEAAETLNRQISQIPSAKLVMRDEASDLNIYEIPLDASLEDRDYLELFDRSWNLGEDEPGWFARMAEGAKGMLRSVGLMKPEPPKERDSEGAGVTSVWTNAYPYANPRVSEDGRFMAYLTDQGENDVTKTRVAVRDLSVKNGDEQIVDDNGFGDNYLSVAGAGDNTVMAWGRSTINLKKDPGAIITDAEQSQMMASSEIVAARWNQDTKSWEIKELTENTVGDVSPVVATNGSRTVIAWRRGAGTDSSQVTNFDARDEIVYRVYDPARGDGEWTGDDAWSEEQILYNGTSGTTSGLEAAMLPDGTTGLVFAADTSRSVNGDGEMRGRSQDIAPASVDETTGEVKSRMEIMFATIRSDSFEEDEASSTRLIRVTSDEYLDENPQIAAVAFPGMEDGEDGADRQRFVLGWHSLQSYNGIQQDDIQLRAFSGDGRMENSFPSAVSKVANSASAMPGGTFRFSKGAETLEELSILWREPAVEVYEPDADPDTGDGTGSETENENTEVTGGETVDYDVLRAMRFTEEEGASGRYGMTAAQILASMGDQTVIENFDAYLKEDRTLAAMILGNCYDTDASEEFPVDFGNGTTRSTVSIAKPEARIYQASGAYRDQLTVDFVMPDYRILYKNSRIPVQIGVTNQGTSAVSNIDVTFEPQEKAGFLGIRAVRKQKETFAFGGEGELPLLLPGESRTLTAYYEIGNSITDVAYTVETTFTQARTRVQTEGTEETPQVMKLDVPDLAISSFEVKKEQDGKRLLQISLYNGNEAKLTETNHDRVVKLGLYTDAECTEPVDDAYLTEIQTRDGQDGAIKTLTKDGSPMEFQMIDEGTYTVQYSFDIAKFIEEADPENDSYRSEDGEIRESGIDLYARVWAEDDDQEEDPDEFVTSNNMQAVHLESLLSQAEGAPASVTSSLKNPDTEDAQTGSQVTVTVQNNSIQEESSGNLIVTLLDANGTILEAKQLYQKDAENHGLLKIPGEGVAERTFAFSKVGTAAKVYYSNDVLDTSTDIKEITLEETSLGLDKFTPYNEETAKNIRVADVEASNLYASQLVVQGNNVAAAIQVEGADQVTAGGENGGKNSQDGLPELDTGTGWYIGNVELRPGKVSQIVIQASEENEQGEMVPVTYIVNVINRYEEKSEKGGAAE